MPSGQRFQDDDCVRDFEIPLQRLAPLRRDLQAFRRLARDGASATGRFAARVRYQIQTGARIEAVHARIRGEYTAVRRAE